MSPRKGRRQADEGRWIPLTRVMCYPLRRLEDNEVMYSSIRLAVLFAFTAGSQVLGQAAWQSSWDEFLKAYQACLNDKQCDPSQFRGALVTWEGTYIGTTVVNGSARFQTRMTPGTMLDRTGTSSQVSNTLLHSPTAAAVGAWQTLGAN